MKIEKWITYDEAEGKAENGLGGTGGWFGKSETGWDAGHRWKDYLDDYKPEVHPMREVLRRSIIEHKIRCTGEEQQNGSHAIPLWSNGRLPTKSPNAWGAL